MKVGTLAAGGVLLVVTSVLANPEAQEHRPAPAAGQADARDAVAAPRVLTHAPTPDSAWETNPLAARSDPVGGLPDLRATGDVDARKARFFAYLLPLVQAENQRLTAIRTRLSYIYDFVRWQREIVAPDRAWLAEVRAEFRIPQGDFSNPDFWVEAFVRVDAVPEDLVLVQAANESGWGTSRFAREGNNLFGQWCFEQGCGMVPAGRPDGATYEVARYGSVSASIGSYIHNLNTGRSYRSLRDIRARRRSEGVEPNATELAAGLVVYSARGIAYVHELQAMIRHNTGLIAKLRRAAETDGKS